MLFERGVLRVDRRAVVAAVAVVVVVVVVAVVVAPLDGQLSLKMGLRRLQT